MGSGSGLDADTIDGINSGQFVRNDVGTGTIQSISSIGVGNSNEIWGLSSSGALGINYRSYDGTTNNFMNTYIGNGKGVYVLAVTGSTKAVTTANNTLDDGSGNMSVAGQLNVTHGSGASQTGTIQLGDALISKTNGSVFSLNSGANFNGPIASTNGNVTAAGQLVSQVAQGTAPLSVVSSTVVPNLNANYVGGLAVTDLVSRYGYNTTNSGASNAGQWTLITSITLTSQYADANVTFVLSSCTNAGGNATTGFLSFRVKQQNAMGSVPYIDLKLICNENVTTGNFNAVTTVNSASQTVVQLYYQSWTSYDTLIYNPIIENGQGAITYYFNQSYSTTLPTGTVTHCSQLGWNGILSTTNNTLDDGSGNISVAGQLNVTHGSGASQTGTIQLGDALISKTNGSVFSLNSGANFNGPIASTNGNIQSLLYCNTQGIPNFIGNWSSPSTWGIGSNTGSTSDNSVKIGTVNLATGLWATQPSNMSLYIGSNRALTTADILSTVAPSGYGLGTTAQGLTNNSDLNTVTATGFYRVNAAVNAPPRVPNDNSAIWHYVIVTNHDTANWVSQIAIEYSTGAMFSRVKSSGAWQTWNIMLSTTPTANSAGYFDTSTTAPTGTTRLNYSGYLYATRIYNAVYNDYAEYFIKDGETEAGDIVMCNTESDGYIKAEGKYNNLVIGVHSDSYGHILGGDGRDDDDERFIPIGLAGKIRVKVTGIVKKGDFIVCSDIPGVGMASQQYIPGTVIGKALETHEGDEITRIQASIMNI